MKIKTKLLLAYLEQRKMSVSDLAKEMEISVTELEVLLNGEAVGEKTAQQFIYYLGANEAQKFIDWEAIGKKNPLAGEYAEDSDDDEV